MNKSFNSNEHKANRQKYYILAQFPYPSGSLHMGHVRVYTAADTIARLKRLEGYNVLHPLGWDAFGLPAENAARERGIDPLIWTKDNISQMKKQLNSLSILIDWDKYELDTSSLDYYKWTKWIFANLFKKGLAYRKEAQVNWDPVDQTVLADEQVSPEGRAWRSGSIVERKTLTQWFLKITEYKEKLLQGLEDPNIDWPEGVKEMQRNWIVNMRDWLISRQRKWGTPIPIAYCELCGPVLTIDNKGNDISIKDKCPKCSSLCNLKPETDTMDTFMDSSWYFLRFLDPKNNQKIFDLEKFKQWLPIDLYIGGIEHAILHLLYSRFIHKFLIEELNIETFSHEPFKRLLCQGLVMGKTLKCPDTQAYLKPDEITKSEDFHPIYTIKSTGKEALISWEKMSKSKYNGIDPQLLIEKYGCDVLRLGILFKAPVENSLYWDEHDLVGISRWINRLLITPCSRIPTETSKKIIDKARFQITKDLKEENCNFHTAIASLMKASNEMDVIGGFDNESLRQFSIMLYPMAPHIASELYSKLPDIGNVPIHMAEWPSDRMNLKSHDFIKVQIDGKVIGELLINQNDNDLINNAMEKFSFPCDLKYKIIKEKRILSFSSRKAKV